MKSEPLEHPSIHDNLVYAYAVLIDQRQLILHTEYRDVQPCEFTDVIFSGVLTHYFEDVGHGNILLDIEEVDPGYIVQLEAELLARRKNYGWPLLGYKDPTDLVRRLNDQGLRGSIVSASLGLGGFVLARDVRYVKRTGRKAFGRPEPQSPSPA